MSQGHCPSCGPLPAVRDGQSHCDACGYPIAVNDTAAGHGTRWLDDANPPDTFAGLTREEFSRLADATPPPQSWYDEDVSGLRGPVNPSVT